jgi:hypothetical protein
MGHLLHPGDGPRGQEPQQRLAVERLAARQPEPDIDLVPDRHNR